MERTDVPPRCSLHKYEPIAKGPYWKGQLPPGRKGNNGYGSRSRVFDHHNEAEVIAGIEAWLEVYGSP